MAYLQSRAFKNMALQKPKVTKGVKTDEDEDKINASFFPKSDIP